MQQNTLRADEGAADSGYEDDFNVWIDQQVAHLRARRFDLLDLDNLIEEVEDMGRNYHRELKHRLCRMLCHLLKCTYQASRKSGSWKGTVIEQRARILDLLDTSPSLGRRVQDYADHAYAHARKLACVETGLALTDFPPTNPYTREQLLDVDFIP